jgi:nitrite reductase/ring-hydroxylating ferredoxin subunit
MIHLEYDDDMDSSTSHGSRAADPDGRERRVKLGKLATIRNGEARGFLVPGLKRKIVILRKDERVFAYLDACPHYPEGTPMAWRTDRYLDVAKTHIVCHSHGALFDIETGACVLGPCLGQKLSPVVVRVNSFGDIEIELDAVSEGVR